MGMECAAAGCSRGGRWCGVLALAAGCSRGVSGGRPSSPYVSGFWREAVKQSKDDGDHGIGTRTKDARTSRDWNLEGR